MSSSRSVPSNPSDAPNQSSLLVTSQEVQELSDLIRRCPPVTNVSVGKVIVTVTTDDQLTFRQFAFTAKPSADNPTPSTTMVLADVHGRFRVWIDKLNAPIFLYDSTNPQAKNTLSFQQTAILRKLIADYHGVLKAAEIDGLQASLPPFLKG